jgi:hypothetical protein|tara:strand:+ start:528 stop:854 length:327 start_codon:yes stop_codon:yes gene_type:complete
MSEYGIDKKQICFEGSTKLHADLKIRLHYDNIKIKEFFNKVVQGYIEKNENIINFIEEIKEKKQTSKTKINENKKMVKKQKETVRKFGLDVEDIENIFDILEKEHPNL